MHDEINAREKKMLELTNISFSPINPAIPMKRNFPSQFRSRLPSSIAATNEVLRNMNECMDDDDDSRASSSIVEHEILDSSDHKNTSVVSANNIPLPSPPSSTRSSFDAIIRDSFLSNDENSENNLDSHSSIHFEGGGSSSSLQLNESNNDSSCSDVDVHAEAEEKMNLCNDADSNEENFDDGIKLLTEELIVNAIDSVEDEQWQSIKIDLDGETILPSGLRIVKGVAEMTFCHDENQDPDRVPRFTNQLNFLKNILNKYICRYKAAGPFLNPVDSVKFKIPHYYLVIKKPMDLNTVKNRLNFLWYQSASECISDIHQIFKNCYQFNSPNDLVYNSGKKLEEYFHEKLKDMPSVEMEIPCPPKPSIEEFQKLMEKRNSKRFNNVNVLNGEQSQMQSIGGVNGSENGKLGIYTPIKMTTRSEKGVMVRKPSKDLPAPISTTSPKLNKPLRDCLKFVQALFTPAHAEYAWPFWKPVDTEAYPDYLQIIKKPIDLSAIKQNILTGKYTSVTEFAKDMRLMFQNCLRYNAPPAPIIDQVRKLREVFEFTYAKFPEEYFPEKSAIPKNDGDAVRHHSSASSSSSSSSHHNHNNIKSSSSSGRKNKKNKQSESNNIKKTIQKIRLSHNGSGHFVNKLEKHQNGNSNISANNSDTSEKRMKMLERQVACLTSALQTISQCGNPANPAAAALLALTSNGFQNGSKSSKSKKSAMKNGYQAKNNNSNKRLSQKSSKKRKHLSSDEEDSDSDADSNSLNDYSEPFDPQDIDNLKKLKTDLENLHATDLQNVLKILQSWEPSLRCDDEFNVEVDFELLKPKTLKELRKYVTSCMLNSKTSPSNHSNAVNNNNLSSAKNKKLRHTSANCSSSWRGSSNFDTDCDNNSINNTWSRADSRASNLQLSESSSSDSEMD